jgi:hypothetical protein
VADAPLSIDAACMLADDGKLIKCLRYAGDSEEVVVRRRTRLIWSNASATTVRVMQW